MKVKLGDVCEKASSNIKQSDIPSNKGVYPIYGASGLLGKVNFFHQEKPYIAVIKDGAGIGRAILCPEKSSVIGTLQYLLPRDNVLPQYLYYVVCHMHLEKYFTGATIPHIYFKDYKNEPFNLVSRDEQQRIINVLGLVENIIDARKKEIVELDNLVKSRFVEMFSIDKGWPLVKLEKLCDSIVRGPFGSALKVSSFVEKGINTVKVYEQKNAIQKSAILGNSYITKERYQELSRFECGPGDFIMSCSGTIGCLYQLPSNAEPGIINQALCKFHLNEKMLPEVFLISIQNSVNRLETKGSGIKNIGAVSFIKNMEIVLPPLCEQEQFAALVKQCDKSKLSTENSRKMIQNVIKYREK